MNHLWSLEQRISWLVMLHSAEFKSGPASKMPITVDSFFMFTLNHLWFPEIFQLAQVFAQEFWDWSFQWEISFQQTSWQWLVQYEWFWAHETLIPAQGWNNNPPKTCVRAVAQMRIVRTARFGRFLPILAKKCFSFCDGKVLQLAGMFQHYHRHIGTQRNLLGSSQNDQIPVSLAFKCKCKKTDY